MASDCVVKRTTEARQRRRVCFNLVVCFVVLWGAAGFFFISTVLPQRLFEDAQSDEPGLPLSTRRTKFISDPDSDSQVDYDLHGDNDDTGTNFTTQAQEATRSFLRMLFADDYFRNKAIEPDVWTQAFHDGVSVLAAESVALLLENIRPPSVRLAPCVNDVTLEALPKNLKRIFIASNQHQSENVLPNFIKQVLDFILDNPQISVFVSIYESGSVDRTPFLLALFSSVLTEIGVGNEIIYDGALNRQSGQGRIEFLSEVRNAALKPLTDHANLGVTYDRMIFINDVFFCKQDMHRLLLHDGDLNCGMDFVHHTLVGRKTKFDPNEIEQIKRMYYGERLKEDKAVQAAISVPLVLRKWDKKTHTEPYKFIARDSETWMDFYDIWVSHDAAGRHFENHPPYVRNNTYEHLRLSEGLPFPAECCWNGVAILNPEPFTKHNLLFRAGAEDECRTSECVLMCHDMQRLGYRKVTVDPGVWTTYSYMDARLLALMGVRGLSKVPWQTVKEADPMKDIHVVPGQLMDCCPLQPGKEIVDFDTCLRNYSIWNVTSALERFGLKEEAPVELPPEEVYEVVEVEQ